jgi:hypothetical protein
MSNTIRSYPCLAHFAKGREMSVTATMQGKWGHAVQFTINGEYAVLAENQVRDLIQVLEKAADIVNAGALDGEGYTVTVIPHKAGKGDA